MKSKKLKFLYVDIKLKECKISNRYQKKKCNNKFKCITLPSPSISELTMFSCSMMNIRIKEGDIYSLDVGGKGFPFL